MSRGSRLTICALAVAGGLALACHEPVATAPPQLVSGPTPKASFTDNAFFVTWTTDSSNNKMYPATLLATALLGDTTAAQYRQVLGFGNYNNAGEMGSKMAAFAANHPGRLYVIGDEPENLIPGNPASNCFKHPPSEYAEWYHEVVSMVQAVDQTALFSPAGMIYSYDSCYPYGLAYAEAFWNAYWDAHGEPPPVTEWRFHFLNFGGTIDEFRNAVTTAANFAAVHGDAQMVVGSWNLDPLRDPEEANYLAKLRAAMAVIRGLSTRGNVAQAVWYELKGPGGVDLIDANGNPNAIGTVYSDPGPTSIFRAGSYTWRIFGDHDQIRWLVSTNNGASWGVVSFGPTYTRTVGSGQHYTMLIRREVTQGGRSVSDIITVPVNTP